MIMNYEELALRILELVGGKENVSGVSHCATRLRLTLKDETLADDESIKNLDGVVAVNRSAGQYQIIIGQSVANVFREMNKLVDVEKAEPVKKKMKFSERIIDFVSAVMLPTIPFILTCGIIKGLNIVLNMIGLYGTDSGVYTLLSAMGDTAFHYIPALFGYNIFKKQGGTPFLGLILGLMLCYPTINGTDINLFGYNVNATYTATILPIILLGLFASWLENFFRKHLPEAVMANFGSALVILISFPIGFAIIGPVSMIISYALSSIINGVYSFSPVVAGFILGGAEQFLVSFGLHFLIMAFGAMDVLQGIPSPIMGLVTGVTPAVAAVCLVAWIKSKDKKFKGNAFNCFVQSIVFGITEPATYGVLMPNIKGFLCCAAGGAIGGVLAALFNLKTYFLSGGGLLITSIPTMLNPEDPHIMPIIITMIAGFVTAFVLAMLFYNPDQNKAEA